MELLHQHVITQRMFISTHHSLFKKNKLRFLQTMILYPQGNSNPRFFREREMSWASRRWGRIFVDSLYEKEVHVNGAL